MHILFFTDNFPPEVNAPASRTFEHCRNWAAKGHQITVITCAPNFPHGKVYLGYRNALWQTEQMEGIKVIRVWSYIAENAGFALRILDYLSYMVMAAIAALFVRKPDIIIGTSPQLFTTCAAWLTAAMRRRPFVFELRDLWPESIKAVGAMQGSRIFDMLERLELFLYRRAALIISVTNAFKTNLISRGIDGRKIQVVTNGVDLTRFSAIPKNPALVTSHKLEGCFVAGYIGTHGMAHALTTLLDAAALLQDREDAAHVKFLFIGSGAEKQMLADYAKAKGLTNVLMLDSVSKDQVADYWSLLDCSVIHLRNTELFQTVIPSKLFESFAVGCPVLLGVRGEAADILADAAAGIQFEPENAAVLAQAIMDLAMNPALAKSYVKNGMAAARKYDRDTLAGNMLAELESIVPPAAL
jgi:glycosyltransferase involved in cell wall biosynthesis